MLEEVWDFVYLLSSVAGLQDVCVIGGLNHDTVLLLPADKSVLDPRVREDLIHVCSFPGIELQHSANDVACLSRQESQQPEGTLDCGCGVGVAVRRLSAHGFISGLLVLVVMMMVMVMFVLSVVVGAGVA